MSVAGLEHILKDLPRRGKLIQTRADLQVWRFEHDGRPFLLHFHRRQGGFRDYLSRKTFGNPALREFHRLQWLQKALVPAPRAVAVLMGFSIDNDKGDAVILDSLEPAVPLDQHLTQLALNARPLPNHVGLVRQLIDLLEKLGRANLGHSNLHLGSFLLYDGKLHLTDAAHIHKGGLTMDDLQRLAHSAAPFAHRTDLLRAWKRLGRGSLPRKNRLAPSLWRASANRILSDESYTGHLSSEDWSVEYFKQSESPRRWSHVSQLRVAEKDWLAAFPMLLQQLESDQFEIIKRSAAGDVLTGEIILAGRPIPVIIKRPKRKFLHRYITDLGRGTRARRAWNKAWKLVVRDIPTAWPMMLAEKSVAGYSTDALIIFEKIPGHTLDQIDVNQLGREKWHELLRRCGRLLRRLESTGLYLYDAKATNWVIRDDPKLGLMPMLIDMEGIRAFRQSSGGMARLSRSIQQFRPHTASADIQAVLRGYDPFRVTRQIPPSQGRTPLPAPEARG